METFELAPDMQGSPSRGVEALNSVLKESGSRHIINYLMDQCSAVIKADSYKTVIGATPAKVSHYKLIQTDPAKLGR